MVRIAETLASAGDAVGHLLDYPRYKVVACLAGASYAFSYMIFSGMLIYDPIPKVSYPMFTPEFHTFQWRGVLGLQQALELHINPHLTLLINPEITLFLVTASLLVAISISMVVYILFNQSKCCEIKSVRWTRKMVPLVAAVPGCSMLGCCGGTLLTFLVGLGFVSKLSPYSPSLAALPLLVLYLNIVYMAKRIGKVANFEGS